MFAPAQWGHHYGRRTSYGHALIVDPWGTVLADGGKETGVVLAEIDPAAIKAARNRVPAFGVEADWVLSAEAWAQRTAS